MDENAYNWRSFTLTFDGPEATWRVRTDDGMSEWRIGMDGVERVSPVVGGGPSLVAQKGAWQRDGKTFTITERDVGHPGPGRSYSFTFEGDEVNIRVITWSGISVESMLGWGAVPTPGAGPTPVPADPFPWALGRRLSFDPMRGRSAQIVDGALRTVTWAQAR
jgi:hypothetical protein